MKKLCLINVYFGENLPPFFDYFLKSVSLNPSVDFLFITNIKVEISVPNVKYLYFTISDFNKLATQNIGFPINIKSGIKLCDFKPAYGIIFSKYLSDYHFWGYIDIDLILGDIRRFITDSILIEHDIISAKKEYLSGFFALYRNTVSINSYFFKSDDIQDILTNDKNYAFDECGNETIKKSLDYNNKKADFFSHYEHSCFCMTHLLQNDKTIRVGWNDFSHEFSPIVKGEFSDILIRNSDTLFSQYTGVEYLLGHLCGLKHTGSFFINKIVWDSNIITCSHLTLTNSFEGQRKEMSARLNLMKKKFKLSEKYIFREGLLINNDSRKVYNLSQTNNILNKFSIEPMSYMELIDNYLETQKNISDIEVMPEESGLYLSPYFNKIYLAFVILFKAGILVEV